MTKEGGTAKTAAKKTPTKPPARENRGTWLNLSLQSYKKESSLNIMLKPLILGILPSLQGLPSLCYKEANAHAPVSGGDPDAFWARIQELATFDLDPQSPPYAITFPSVNKELAADRIGIGSKYHMVLHTKLEPEYVALAQRLQSKEAEEVCDAFCYAVEPALANSFRCIRLAAAACLRGFMLGLLTMKGATEHALDVFMHEGLFKTMSCDVCDTVRYIAVTTVTALLSPAGVSIDQLNMLLGATKTAITDESPAIRITGFALLLKLVTIGQLMMSQLPGTSKRRLGAAFIRTWEQCNTLYTNLLLDECPESAAFAALTLQTFTCALPIFQPNERRGREVDGDGGLLTALTFSTHQVLRRIAGIHHYELFASLATRAPGRKGNSVAPDSCCKAFFNAIYMDILKETPTMLSLVCLTESVTDLFAHLPLTDTARTFFTSLLPALLTSIDKDEFTNILTFTAHCLVYCKYKRVPIFDQIIEGAPESIYYDDALETLKDISSMAPVGETRAVLQYAHSILLDEEEDFIGEANYDVIAETILGSISVFAANRAEVLETAPGTQVSVLSIYSRFLSMLGSYGEDNMPSKMEQLCSNFLYFLYTLVECKGIFQAEGSNLISESFQRDLNGIYEGMFMNLLPQLGPALYHAVSTNTFLPASARPDKAQPASPYAKIVPKILAHYLAFNRNVAEPLVSSYIQDQLRSLYTTLSRHEFPALQYGLLADIVGCMQPSDITVYDNVVASFKLDPIQLQRATYCDLENVLRLLLTSLIWLKGASRVTEQTLDNFLFGILVPVSFTALRSSIYFQKEIQEGVRVSVIQRNLTQYPGLLSLISTVVHTCLIVYTTFADYYNNPQIDRTKMENISDIIMHMYCCAHFLGKEFISARDECAAELKVLGGSSSKEVESDINADADVSTNKKTVKKRSCATRATYNLLLKAHRTASSIIELAFQSTFTVFQGSSCYYTYLYANLASMTLANRFLLNSRFMNLTCPGIVTSQAGAVKVIPAYATQYAGFLEISKLSMMLTRDEFTLYRSFLPNYGNAEETVLKYCSLVYGAYAVLKRYNRTRQQAARDYITLCSILRVLEATDGLAYPRSLLEDAINPPELAAMETHIAQLLQRNAPDSADAPHVPGSAHQTITDIPALSQTYSSSQILPSDLFHAPGQYMGRREESYIVPVTHNHQDSDLEPLSETASEIPADRDAIPHAEITTVDVLLSQNTFGIDSVSSHRNQ